MIIVGNSSVGKTCLMEVATGHKFDDTYDTTLGAECAYMTTEINGKIFKLQIWDTAGTEAYLSVTRIFYRNSLLAFICFSISK